MCGVGDRSPRAQKWKNRAGDFESTLLLFLMKSKNATQFGGVLLRRVSRFRRPDAAVLPRDDSSRASIRRPAPGSPDLPRVRCPRRLPAHAAMVPLQNPFRQRCTVSGANRDHGPAPAQLAAQASRFLRTQTHSQKRPFKRRLRIRMFLFQPQMAFSGPEFHVAAAARFAPVSLRFDERSRLQPLAFPQRSFLPRACSAGRAADRASASKESLPQEWVPATTARRKSISRSRSQSRRRHRLVMRTRTPNRSRNRRIRLRDFPDAHRVGSPRTPRLPLRGRETPRRFPRRQILHRSAR